MFRTLTVSRGRSTTAQTSIISYLMIEVCQTNVSLVWSKVETEDNNNNKVMYKIVILY